VTILSRATYLYKLQESGIALFFFLELVFTVELMRTIFDEGSKIRYEFEKDVSNRVDNWLLFLPSRKTFRHLDVDGVDLGDVPEYLLNELLTPRLGYSGASLERCHPFLRNKTD